MLGTTEVMEVIQKALLTPVVTPDTGEEEVIEEEVEEEVVNV